MKQCPKCSVTYANDKQKFCTKDGTALVDAQQSARQDETVRIDSAQLDDEVTKFISRELPQGASGAFDPYKTTVSTPQTPSPPPQTSQPPPSAVTPSQPAPEPQATDAGKFDPFKTTIAESSEATGPVDTRQTAASPPPPVAATTPPVAATTPPVAATTPAVGTTTPAVGTTTPAVAATTPAVGTTTPPVAAATPPVAAATPAVGTTTPAVAVATPAGSAPKKRSKLPLILGILVVLFVLGAGSAAAGYFFLAKPWLEKRRPAVLQPPRPEPTPIVVTTPDVGITKPETPKIEVPPYSPPADAVQFVNSNAKLTGKLADHYVDFSFYYPDRWRKDPEAGTSNSTNFARVLRQLAPDAPQEIFAVGWYDSTGAKDTDELSYPRLVADRSAQLAKTYPEYTKISDGPAKVGPYDAYEFRFKGMYRNTARGDIQIWGRVLFVPPLEGNRGVTLLMFASSLAPEVKSVDDVGNKGELPMMLESFRFGK